MKYLSFYLMGILLISCGDEQTEMARVKIKIPQKFTTSLREIFRWTDNTEAFSNCHPPVLRLRAHRPGIYPPILSQQLDAVFDPYTSPYLSFSAGQNLEMVVPKGNGLMIDLKGLAYDSTCTTSTSNNQTFIVYGKYGPFDLNGDTNVNLSTVVGNVGTTNSLGTALTFPSFSQLRIGPSITCALPATSTIQDLDLNTPIIHYATTTMTGANVHIGPLFPNSVFSISISCSSGTGYTGIVNTPDINAAGSVGLAVP